MGKTGMTFYSFARGSLKSEVVAREMLPPYSDEHFDIIKTPHFIKNGSWVMLGVSGPSGYNQWFVGDRQGFETIELKVLGGGMPRTLWVSKTPFGMLRWDRCVDDTTWLPTGGILFESAKQIYNGQLNQLAPIPQLERVHERDSRAQGNKSWSRVSDLVRVSGLGFAEIIELFWPFVNPNYQPWSRFPATLKMVRSVGAEGIKAQQFRVEELTQDELLLNLKSDPAYYNDGWLSTSLARTILRLIALGYQPIGATHA